MGCTVASCVHDMVHCMLHVLMHMIVCIMIHCKMSQKLIKSASHKTGNTENMESSADLPCRWVSRCTTWRPPWASTPGSAPSRYPNIVWQHTNKLIYKKTIVKFNLNHFENLFDFRMSKPPNWNLQAACRCGGAARSPQGLGWACSWSPL